jgi:hypothetical protein
MPKPNPHVRGALVLLGLLAACSKKLGGEGEGPAGTAGRPGTGRGGAGGSATGTTGIGGTVGSAGFTGGPGGMVVTGGSGGWRGGASGTIGAAGVSGFAGVGGDPCPAAGSGGPAGAGGGTGGSGIVSPVFSFDGARAYDVGSDLTAAVALGDLNGDGKPDLVSASSTVQISLNAGDGTFAAPRAAGTGWPQTMAAALGDVNGDHKPDLVVTFTNGAAGTVGVLLNGGGTFSPSVTYAVGGTPGMLALGDIDGDGDLDLVTADPQSYGINVLLNQGGGKFGEPSGYPT